MNPTSVRTLEPGEAGALLDRARLELHRTVVGQERLLERVLVGLLADGHCLLEGVPGIGKTLTVSSLAHILGGSFTRLQFTPDLIPADIVGTRIYRPSVERFDVELGPIFANFVLADEINRAPAKVQSALLEVMGERQVSIGGVTHKVPAPFLVLATQNPIESEGVYPLPEAQRDRFLMRVPVDYPTPLDEHEIVARSAVAPDVPDQVLSLHDVAALQAAAARVEVSPEVVDYAVRLVLTPTTRGPTAWLASTGTSPTAPAREPASGSCGRREPGPAARPGASRSPGHLRHRLRRPEPPPRALVRRHRRRHDRRRRARRPVGERPAPQPVPVA